jgi:hypothetical protein
MRSAPILPSLALSHRSDCRRVDAGGRAALSREQAGINGEVGHGSSRYPSTMQARKARFRARAISARCKMASFQAKGVSIFPLRLARHTLPTVRGSRIFSAGRNDKVIEKVLFAAVRKSLPV